MKIFVGRRMVSAADFRPCLRRFDSGPLHIHNFTLLGEVASFNVRKNLVYVNHILNLRRKVHIFMGLWVTPATDNPVNINPNSSAGVAAPEILEKKGVRPMSEIKCRPERTGKPGRRTVHVDSYVRSTPKPIKKRC